MLNFATVRIGCDGDQFDGPRNKLDGRKITIWSGSALRFELAFFRRGVLQNLEEIGEIVLEVREMGPHGAAPTNSISPIVVRRVPAADFCHTMALADWENGSAQQVAIEFSSAETAMAAGDVWLSIWGRAADDPENCIAFAAGPMAVCESSCGTPLQPPGPIGHFYGRDECDNLFARKDLDLSDMANSSEARHNLGLGSAALMDVLGDGAIDPDGDAAVPTQHFMKNYVDSVGGEMLTEAKNYADEAFESVAAGAEAANGPENYWPGSLRPLFSSYAEKPYFIGANAVCAVDGWMICGESATAMPANHFAAGTGVDGDAICFSRPTGSVESGVYHMNRPFTRAESEIFVGKTVTISLEMKFGSGFPMSSAGNGLAISINGTASASVAVQLRGDGTYSSSNVVLFGPVEITSGSQSAYERHSFTFSVSASVRMFNLALSHLPVGSGPSVPSDYKFYLARPTAAIGADVAPYGRRSYGEEYLNSCVRYVRVRSAFMGPTVAGVTYYDHRQFPIPMASTPLCIRATDEVAPSKFLASSAEDVLSIDNYGFSVARTASGDGEDASWRTIYGFGVFPWTFSDPIGEY
ncbi:MAG: hypothetical protein LBI39_04015 [Puniceicoccales bacterium]|jgi:hypothetical protein|nr:hypothetical protein [Puniceicoccales bacterium]